MELGAVPPGATELQAMVLMQQERIVQLEADVAQLEKHLNPRPAPTPTTPSPAIATPAPAPAPAPTPAVRPGLPSDFEETCGILFALLILAAFGAGAILLPIGAVGLRSSCTEKASATIVDANTPSSGRCNLTVTYVARGRKYGPASLDTGGGCGGVGTPIEVCYKRNDPSRVHALKDAEYTAYSSALGMTVAGAVLVTPFVALMTCGLACRACIPEANG